VLAPSGGSFVWIREVAGLTLRARWVTLRARWVTLRARWVTSFFLSYRCTAVAPQDKVQEMYEKTSGALSDEQLEEMRKLQTSRSQLSQHVSQLEHAARVKEQDVERLKAKVQELYERTSGTSREEEAEETRRLQVSRNQLSAQVSQLEHAARAREQDVARLKAKVQELYQRSTLSPVEEAAAELRRATLARDQLTREVGAAKRARWVTLRALAG
jgi:predicted RNase H-like nuclease (RuvC/YqgF family)